MVKMTKADLQNAPEFQYNANQGNQSGGGAVVVQAAERAPQVAQVVELAVGPAARPGRRPDETTERGRKASLPAVADPPLSSHVCVVTCLARKGT